MPKRPSESHVLVLLLEEVRKREAYQNRWMSPENWIKVIQMHCEVPDGIKPTNKMLSYGVKNYFKKRAVDPFWWEANGLGFYAATNGTPGGGKKVAYCSMPKGEMPTTVPANIEWDALQQFDVENLRLTRKRARTLISKGKISDSGAELPFRMSVGKRQSRRLGRPTLTPIKDTAKSSQVVTPVNNSSSATNIDFATWVYWTSPEAKKYFGLVKPENMQEQNECTTSVVQRRIKRCKACYQLPGGWRKLVEDLDSQDLYTEYDVHMLQWNCRYLVKALELALANMNDWQNWEKCCKAAIVEIKEFEEFEYITCPEVIMRFHRKLRLNNECFNLQGYWTYEWMVIQLEDCIDVLQALQPHGENCDYLFMFDHSNGHDKQRPDGLNANAMNKKFGGSQPRMRSTVIKDEDHLGPYNFPGRLQVGDTQDFTFQSTDVGPCWMTPEEQLQNKNDVELRDEPMVTNVFMKPHLVAKLKEKGLDFNGSKEQLQKRCEDNDIAISEKRWKVKQGWFNQPKGMLQILWERGFIDPNIPLSELEKRYPVGGRKDNLRQVIPGTAMKEILAALPDFAGEKSLLQWHAEERKTAYCRILFIRSPKCHPEIAGEGIEYDWAGAKTIYRHAKLSEKKGAAGFKKLVVKCLEGIGFHQRVSFSARARQYMLAYEVMAAWEDGELPDALKDGHGSLPESSAQLLDKIVKCRKKCHRSIDSKDGAWVNRIMDAMKEHDHVIVVE